jgi:hypothetical protein
MAGDDPVSVTLVRLPSLWQTIGRELWTVESALGAGGFRDVARRTHAFSADGTKHEVTCLAQHGVERRSMYGLFLEELRARGWLREGDDPPPLSAPSRRTRRLFLVPAIPVPPTVNASTRMLLSLGLHEAVLKSVRNNPPPPGSTGPNHFLIVARVCSCFISADRRPHLGKRARDECQPFQRIGPTRGELHQAVRILSWEQVTPLDRRWSASAHVPPRRANLVVPYPSSLLGADPSKGRMAPWQLATLRKPVRVFAAFGMLSNLTRQESAAKLARFATACAPSEQAMIAQSSCYGKTCRFALRALVMAQVYSLPRANYAMPWPLA